MKKKTFELFSALVVTGCLLVFATGCSTSDKNLAAQARVSRDRAEGIALAGVPGGRVVDGELEKEHGHLVWSFDIAVSGTPDITEVQVDAVSAEVVSRTTETPAQQAKERGEP